MSIELQVELDRKSLTQFRRLLVAGKTEAAKALTFTAQKAQTAWRAENHRVFHMRNSWIDKGVRIQPATANRLESRVGSIDRYMGRHVDGVGEQKRAAHSIDLSEEDGHLQAHGGLFVPNEDLDHLTHTGIRQRLRAMTGTQRKPFWIQGRGGTPLLVRRLGKGRTPLTVIDHLREMIRIEPRMDAVGLVQKTTEREFPSIYERLLVNWSKTQ